jgi:MFS family permease
MKPSQQSLRALDWSNLFMADVKDGVGVYLSVFLLTVRHWEPDEIGFVIAVPGIVGILVQPPAGALIDRTRHKRFLINAASFIIALCCLAIILFSSFWPVFTSQAIVGFVQSVYAPCVAAITLGLVGHERLAKRVGRNDTFNHIGNMLAAVISGLLGRFASYQAIFAFSIFQCLVLIACILFIKEKDIDHEVARGAINADEKEGGVSGIKELFRDKNIQLFAVAIMLFHLSNGSLLPLLGQKIGIADPKNSALYLSAAIIIAQGIMGLVASPSGKRADVSRKKVMTIAFILLPIRAALFAFIGNPYVLTALQILDGIGAGIFGVVSVLMIADLSRGTGRFNLLQGTIYSAIGLALSLSSVLSGLIVKWFGYPVGFISLAVAGVGALFFFKAFVPETKDLHQEKAEPK